MDARAAGLEWCPPCNRRLEPPEPSSVRTYTIEPWQGPEHVRRTWGHVVQVLDLMIGGEW
jgi:hypothetical protein